jgi:hypothetical protein
VRDAVHPGARARPVLLGSLPDAWNREHAGVAAAPAVAIDWSVTAMTESAGRLATAGAWDLSRLLAARPRYGRVLVWSWLFGSSGVVQSGIIL